MTFPTEMTFVVVIVVAALGILAWGYGRARNFGRLGILAWLQSVVLMAPWLLFFGMFALGIYLNLIAIVMLLVVSAGVYIYLGNQLRAAGQDELLRQRALERLQQQADMAPPATEEVKEGAEMVAIPAEDLQTIKGIFGIDTFFLTETIAYQEGAIFRGNLRHDPEEVHQKLSQALHQRLPDRYHLFLVEGPEGRPVVIVLPRQGDPVMTLGQKNLAVVLIVSTVVTSLEAIGLLLGFDFFQTPGRFAEALPLAAGIWFVLLVHELGHGFLAKKYQVGLSWPFVIPNWQIGAFGAITRFTSPTPDRRALFDISFAGPAAGGIASLLFLILGLLLSRPGVGFDLPSQFLQGSILVGTLAKVVLGEAVQQSLISVHPLVVLGWLGLVINALNLLPAGQLDGGRIVQAIYGRAVARRASIASLIALGVIALFNPANPIPLYWAVVILFLQRGAERPSLNELTEPDDTRAALGLLALFLMLATLMPLSSSLAVRLGIGGLG